MSEKKDEKVLSRNEERDSKNPKKESEKKAETAYERKANDSTGRDWTKRASFKPNGTV